MSQEFIKHLLHARHQPGASLRQRQMERFKDLSMSQHRQVSRDIDPAHRRLSSQKGKQMLKCLEQEGQRATSFHVQKTQPHHLLPMRPCSASLWNGAGDGTNSRRHREDPVRYRGCGTPSTEPGALSALNNVIYTYS